MNSRSFIVGDAGGTKTHWRIVENGSIIQLETSGFNAYTHSLADFAASVEELLQQHLNKRYPFYLYAAGVDTTEQASEVAAAIRSYYQGEVEVANDLLGVARALCGKHSGNVCILGTGANACYYDGSKVNKVSSSLGYILGDEGSGAYLGKVLLREAFRDRLPEKVTDRFKKEFNLTSHQVIQKLYNEPQANRYLASFAPFVLAHKNDPVVYRLIYSAFHDFFNAFFPHVSDGEEAFYFCGSVAHYFSDVLRLVATDRGLSIQQVMQSPIAGLVLYHQENG